MTHPNGGVGFSSIYPRTVEFDFAGYDIDSSNATINVIDQNSNLDTNAFDIQFDDAKGIRDSSDNEQLIFQLTASAVNYLEMTNAATANDPSFVATGSDTDVGLIIDGKGVGTIAVGSADSVITLTATSISGSAIKDEDDMTSDSAIPRHIWTAPPR